MQLATEIAYACRIFTIRRDRSRFSRDDAEHDFHVLESTDWVNIIPITPAQDVVFVRQFRHGVRSHTLEIPGGMIDDGESDRQAAERELFEETGYRAAHWHRLGEVHPNPAFLANRCASWVARGLERVGDPTGDGEEEITVEHAALGAIPALVTSGAITHALVIAAFYLLDHSAPR